MCKCSADCREAFVRSALLISLVSFNDSQDQERSVQAEVEVEVEVEEAVVAYNNQAQHTHKSSMAQESRKVGNHSVEQVELDHNIRIYHPLEQRKLHGERVKISIKIL